MVIKYRYVPRHKNGHFINIYSEPTEDFMKAAHFSREDDLNIWILGRYGPDDPQNFHVVPVKVTYELEVGESHVQ